jgi:hypothetical protein
MNTGIKDYDTKRFLAQNAEVEEINNESEISDSDNINSLETQNEIDSLILDSRNDKNFNQCSDIYSEDELNE